MKEKSSKYMKVSTAVINKIRIRFEFGEDLKKLSTEYKVNYGTLKNYASQKNWDKGSKAEVIYLKEFDKAVIDLAVIRKEQDELHIQLHRKYVEDFVAEERGGVELSKGNQESRYIKLKRIKESYEFGRTLYNYDTELEDINKKIKILEYKRLEKEMNDRDSEDRDEEEFEG